MIFILLFGLFSGKLKFIYNIYTAIERFLRVEVLLRTQEM